ncbi:MAG: GNAT family N-acetyltransferase [Cellvibrionaceae bacterium]
MSINNSQDPKNAITDDEIIDCFKVLCELRPHLNKNEFLNTIREMESEGFQLAFIRNSSEVVAVAGYRIYSNLFMGKHLYVDDLVTSEGVRSKGHGKKLLEWLRMTARKNGCNYIHLDSGTHRGEAHKFYFNQNFTIASYHFSQKLVDHY